MRPKVWAWARRSPGQFFGPVLHDRQFVQGGGWVALDHGKALSVGGYVEGHIVRFAAEAAGKEAFGFAGVKAASGIDWHPHHGVAFAIKQFVAVVGSDGPDSAIGGDGNWIREIGSAGDVDLLRRVDGVGVGD